MRKLMISVAALGLMFANTANAADGFVKKAFDAAETAINNARENIRKSLGDVGQYSKETRELWGKDNVYQEEFYEEEPLSSSSYAEQESYKNPRNLITPDQNFYEEEDMFIEPSISDYPSSEDVPEGFETVDIDELPEVSAAIE
ncbi:MAG: hypothetical protein LBR70_00430 [Lactobacillaceae bacterium]|jgi:hypothetical protein|nr:hypothetical protein [Lactobacillaceae bacterium]